MSDWQRLRFSFLPKSIKESLAMHLDEHIGPNWQFLAEKLQCPMEKINWYKNKAIYSPLGSPTLVFFEEFCLSHDIPIITFVDALRNIGNETCVNILMEALSDGSGCRSMDGRNHSLVDHGPTKGFIESPLLRLEKPYGHGAPNGFPDTPSPPLSEEKEFQITYHCNGENDLEDGNLKSHSIPSLFMLPGSDDRISLNSDEFSSLSGNVCNSIDSRRDIDFEDYGLASDYKDTPTPMYIGLLRNDYNIPSITEGSALDLRTDLKRNDAAVAPEYSPSERHIFSRLSNGNENFVVKQEPLDETKCDLRRPKQENIVVASSSNAPIKAVINVDAPVRRIENVVPQSRLAATNELTNQTPLKHVKEKERVNNVPGNKRITDPLTEKDKRLLTSTQAAMNNLSISASPVVQHTPFKQDPRKIRVFVTYSLDSKEHMKNVVGLCDCMKKNGFSISIDFRENQLVAMDRIGWIDTRFQSADYILVLVSPQYFRDVSSTPSDKSKRGNASQPGSASDAGLNALYIFRLMQAEYTKNECSNHRFIPVLMQGATRGDVPTWLQNTTVYEWPKHYQDLFFYLLYPTKVLRNFIKWERDAKNPSVRLTKS